MLSCSRWSQHSDVKPEPTACYAQFNQLKETPKKKRKKSAVPLERIALTHNCVKTMNRCAYILKMMEENSQKTQRILAEEVLTWPYRLVDLFSD